MEAGSYVPNTVVALKLARVLEATVEEIFALPAGLPDGGPRTEEASLLAGGGAGAAHAGELVQLCRVDERLIASAPSPVPWYLPAGDGVVTVARGGGRKAKVEVFQGEPELGNRLLIAGCDPAISILAKHARAAGIELVLAHRNSSQALALLKDGAIHIAGTHLRDESSGEGNLPAIARLFPRNSVAVVSFAIWEEGIVTARGNPKRIRGVEDMARADVAIVNRDAGAGSRILLDGLLERAGIKPRRVRGYAIEVQGHLPAAWQVESGAADCSIATRAAARAFGLDFIPLVSERYDLVIRRQHFDLPLMQTLLDAMSRAAFRRELESLGGYDTRLAGKRLL